MITAIVFGAFWPQRLDGTGRSPASGTKTIGQDNGTPADR
jgi:hypothetical protein